MNARRNQTYASSPRTSQEIRREAPSFRGTNRLKFTLEEMQAIRVAERARGYPRLTPPHLGIAHTLFRVLAALFFAVALVTVLQAGLSLFPRIFSKMDATFAQAKPQDIQNNTRPSPGSTVNLEELPIISQTNLVDLQPLPEPEQRLPLESKAESDYLSALVEELSHPHWTEVEADEQADLFEEPRFNSVIVGGITPGSNYYVIDIHLLCDDHEDFTWKLASIDWSNAQPHFGFVCSGQLPAVASDGQEDSMRGTMSETDEAVC